MYFAYLTCTTSCDFELELRRCPSRTRLVPQVAIFELELRKCTSRTRLALHSCDFRAELRKCTLPRLVLQSCGFRAGDCGSVLRVLDWHYKVAIFELELRKCPSRTRLVLQSCDFRAGAAEVYFAY